MDCIFLACTYDNPTATQTRPDAIYYQLAENYYHKERRRSETRVIYTFGRADQVDPEACAAWLRASCVWPTTIASICPPVSSRQMSASTTSSRFLTMVSCIRLTPCGRARHRTRFCGQDAAGRR